MTVLRKEDSGSRNSWCRGPEMGTRLVGSSTSEEASVVEGRDGCGE